MDVLYVGVIVFFTALVCIFAIGCDNLGEQK